MRSQLERVGLDDLDRALIARLRIDGRESNRSLAAALHVNKVTVASRLRRMAEAGIMRVVAVTDMRLFGHREFAIAMVQVCGRSAHQVAGQLAELPESVSVTICTGRCDIIVPILGRDRRHLGELLDTVLHRIDGVDEVRASLALDVLKFDSKWSLLEADPGTTPEALPSESVDAIDLKIIRTLQLNARRSNRGIAAELGVSEGTVRSRIKHMQSERVFRIQAVCDVVAFGLAAHAFIGIETVSGAVDAVAAELTSRDDIAQLSRVLGDFDLIAVVVAPDRDTLIAAILNEISQISGVRNTETFDTCATVKHTHAWTWIV